MILAAIIIGILLLTYLLFFLENRRFVTRAETIRHEKVKEPFAIVQVSDLHDRKFGAEQGKLLSAIRKAEPDFIQITGDLFNRHNARVYKNAYAFVRGAVKIAPVYFAEGNHECALGKTGERYMNAIREMDVHVLRDEYADCDSVRLIGLRQYASPQTLDAMLSENKLNIVMAHRPELFPIYAGTGADVILSGHAHGGQIRLFGHGIFAPGQGFFPRYTSGIYRSGTSLLHLSRGLGNTILVPRVFDTPELNILKFIPNETKEKNYV